MESKTPLVDHIPPYHVQVQRQKAFSPVPAKDEPRAGTLFSNHLKSTSTLHQPPLESDVTDTSAVMSPMDAAEPRLFRSSVSPAPPRAFQVTQVKIEPRKLQYRGGGEKQTDIADVLQRPNAPRQFRYDDMEASSPTVQLHRILSSWIPLPPAAKLHDKHHLMLDITQQQQYQKDAEQKESPSKAVSLNAAAKAASPVPLPLQPEESMQMQLQSTELAQSYAPRYRYSSDYVRPPSPQRHVRTPRIVSPTVEAVNMPLAVEKETPAEAKVDAASTTMVVSESHGQLDTVFLTAPPSPSGKASISPAPETTSHDAPIPEEEPPSDTALEEMPPLPLEKEVHLLAAVESIAPSTEVVAPLPPVIEAVTVPLPATPLSEPLLPLQSVPAAPVEVSVIPSPSLAPKDDSLLKETPPPPKETISPPKESALPKEIAAPKDHPAPAPKEAEKREAAPQRRIFDYFSPQKSRLFKMSMPAALKSSKADSLNAKTPETGSSTHLPLKEEVPKAVSAPPKETATKPVEATAMPTEVVPSPPLEKAPSVTLPSEAPAVEEVVAPPQVVSESAAEPSAAGEPVQAEEDSKPPTPPKEEKPEEVLDPHVPMEVLIFSNEQAHPPPAVLEASQIQLQDESEDEQHATFDTWRQRDDTRVSATSSSSSLAKQEAKEIEEEADSEEEEEVKEQEVEGGEEHDIGEDDDEEEENEEEEGTSEVEPEEALQDKALNDSSVFQGSIDSVPAQDHVASPEQEKGPLPVSQAVTFTSYSTIDNNISTADLTAASSVRQVYEEEEEAEEMSEPLPVPPEPVTAPEPLLFPQADAAPREDVPSQVLAPLTIEGSCHGLACVCTVDYREQVIKCISTNKNETLTPFPIRAEWILKVKKVEGSSASRSVPVKLRFVQPLPRKKCTPFKTTEIAHTDVFFKDQSTAAAFYDAVSTMVAQEIAFPARPSNIAVVVNPPGKSSSETENPVYQWRNVAQPLLEDAGCDLNVIELEESSTGLAELRRQVEKWVGKLIRNQSSWTIDAVLCCGGDGLLNMVCNAFSDRLGDKPIPPLAILPFGKSNAIASSVYDGSNDLLESCLHLLHGKAMEMRPLKVDVFEADSSIPTQTSLAFQIGLGIQSEFRGKGDKKTSLATSLGLGKAATYKLSVEADDVQPLTSSLDAPYVTNRSIQRANSKEKLASTGSFASLASAGQGSATAPPRLWLNGETTMNSAPPSSVPHYSSITDAPKLLLFSRLPFISNRTFGFRAPSQPTGYAFNAMTVFTPANAKDKVAKVTEAMREYSASPATASTKYLTDAPEEGIRWFTTSSVNLRLQSREERDRTLELDGDKVTYEQGRVVIKSSKQVMHVYKCASLCQENSLGGANLSKKS